MKNILVICPTQRAKDFLQSVSGPYNFLFDEFTAATFDEALLMPAKAEYLLDWAAILSSILKRYTHSKIDGVISTSDYPGSLIASYLANYWKIPSSQLISLLIAHHKYYSRLYQQRFVWQAVPRFALVGKNFNQGLYDLELPFFLKPVKSCLSMHARVIHTHDELESLIEKSLMPQPFLAPINYFIAQETSWEFDANYLIAEELLRGVQVTLEGYMFNGEFQCLGIVDSVMYPNTISFERFEYPSCLPLHVQCEMEKIAQRFLRNIGFDYGMFNIEFIYDARIDKIWIIEVNPRIACQFQSLYRSVDAINSYQILVDLSVGKKPCMIKESLFNCAAIAVLRTFEDKMVLDIPSEQQIQSVYQKYPECYIEIFAQKGKLLSELRQDEASYRYCTISLGGTSKQNILEKLEHCKQLLKFNFA